MMQLVYRIVLLLVISAVITVADPQGCTYYEAELKYECNAINWRFPLEYSSFNYTPQVLSVINFNGELPSSAPLGPTFTGFEDLDTTLLDSNIIPTLSITCSSNGQVIMTAGTFKNMSWINELYFDGCRILNLPDEVFKDFVELNVLSISGGSISNIGFNAFTGLNIYPMNVPNPRGTLAIQNSQVVSAGFPNGVLYELTNITNILLENAHLRVIQLNMFKYCTKLQYLSLRDNSFKDLTNGMFDSLTALSTIDLHGIPWTCTCNNLWFLDYFQSNNITMKGNAVCNEPADYLNVRGSTYEKEVCPQPDACGDTPGVPYQKQCITYFELTGYIMLFITLIIGIATLVIIIHLRRQLDIGSDDSPGKPEFGGRKLSGTSWNKVSISRGVTSIDEMDKSDSNNNDDKKSESGDNTSLVSNNSKDSKQKGKNKDATKSDILLMDKKDEK